MWGRYFGSHVVFSHVNMTLVESVHDSLVARRPSLVASQEGNLAALSLAKKNMQHLEMAGRLQQPQLGEA